jgi:hypothetical protein
MIKAFALAAAELLTKQLLQLVFLKHLSNTATGTYCSGIISYNSLL